MCDTVGKLLGGHLTLCYFPLELTDLTSRTQCLSNMSTTYYGLDVVQGCPILLLKGQRPAEFSSSTLAWKFLLSESEDLD